MGMGNGRLPLVSSLFQWLDGNSPELLEPQVTAFPGLGYYSRRGLCRQKNIRIHERNVQREFLPSFFSIDEESIGQHLLAKLIWFRAIRRHSNQIKFPPVSWTAQNLHVSGPLHMLPPHAQPFGKCFPVPALLIFTWLIHTDPSGLLYSGNGSVTPLILPGLGCGMFNTFRLHHLSSLHNSDSLFPIFLPQIFCNLGGIFDYLAHCGIHAQHHMQHIMGTRKMLIKWVHKRVTEWVKVNESNRYDVAGRILSCESRCLGTILSFNFS